MAKGKKGRVALELLEAALAQIEPLSDDQLEQSSPEELLQKAQELAAEYDFSAAASLYKEAVIRSAGHPDIVETFARFLVEEAGLVEQALALFSVSGCVENSSCRRLFARSLHMAGQEKKALEQWELVNSEDPDEESLAMAASLHIKVGEIRKALGSVERLGLLYPQNLALKEMERGIREALAPFWESEVAEVSQLLNDHAPVELLASRVGSWTGLPGPTAKALDLRRLIENRLLDEQAANAVVKARENLAAGETQQAVTLLKQALEIRPEHEEAARLLKQADSLAEKVRYENISSETGARFRQGDGTETIVWLMERGLADNQWLELVPDAYRPLAELAMELRREFGSIPSVQKLQAASALESGMDYLDQDKIDEAELVAARTGRSLAGYSRYEALVERLGAKRTERRLAEAKDLFSKATDAFLQGQYDESDGLLKRLSAMDAEDIAGIERLQTQVNEALRIVRETGSAKKRLAELLGSQRYFEAGLLLESSAAVGLDRSEISVAAASVKEGIQNKWPWNFQKLNPGHSGPEYRSETQGISGVPTDQTLRVLVPYPGSELVILSAGQKAWLISIARMEMVGVLQLPPSADLNDQRGVLLGDRTSGNEGMLLYLHLGNDSLLDFRWNPDGIRLNYAGQLSSVLPPAKAAHTRWFAPLGSEERFVVCQSAPDGSEASRLMSVPLIPGKSLLDQEAGYPLGHVRRLGQSPNLFLVHRYPNPPAMRLPGYFSFAFMDDRLRLTERFHIAPSQLDNVIIEAARWVRLSEDGEKVYALFSYFEGMTGQLIQRPLAFVAMERSGSLLYAVSDSSVLVQDHGDIEPTAEIASWNGREYLACVVRKGEVQSMTLVDLATFKLVKRWDCADGERLLAIVKGIEPGTVVCISAVKSDGTIRMRRHAIADAL